MPSVYLVRFDRAIFNGGGVQYLLRTKCVTFVCTCLYTFCVHTYCTKQIPTAEKRYRRRASWMVRLRELLLRVDGYAAARLAKRPSDDRLFPRPAASHHTRLHERRSAASTLRRTGGPRQARLLCGCSQLLTAAGLCPSLSPSLAC